MTINGVEVGSEADAPGSRTLQRRWATGDRIELTLPMPPRVTRPLPLIDAVRGTIAIERGPIVYAIEEPDLPAGVALESIEVPGDPRIEVGSWVPPLPAGAATLSLDAFVRAVLPSTGWPYGPAALLAEESSRDLLRLHAVPYFATGNRGGTGMRVGLPVAPAEMPLADAAPEQAVAGGGGGSS